MRPCTTPGCLAARVPKESPGADGDGQRFVGVIAARLFVPRFVGAIAERSPPRGYNFSSLLWGRLRDIPNAINAGSSPAHGRILKKPKTTHKKRSVARKKNKKNPAGKSLPPEAQDRQPQEPIARPPQPVKSCTISSAVIGSGNRQEFGRLRNRPDTNLRLRARWFAQTRRLPGGTANNRSNHNALRDQDTHRRDKRC